MERQLLYYNRGNQEKVTISITKPEKDFNSNDWFCFCNIEGADLNDSMCVFGIDSIQALLLSVDALRAKLKYYKKTGCDLKWHVDLGDGLS